MSEPDADFRRVTMTAPGLWAVTDATDGSLNAYRLDWPANNRLAFRVEELDRLELMLLETRLRYALDRVRIGLEAKEARP